MLEGIDVVLYDIQDVGLRFYTYIYALAYMLEECGKRNIPVIVLDRPDILSGKIEGPVIKSTNETTAKKLPVSPSANFFRPSFIASVNIFYGNGN